jgi:3-hydroxyisobutyrate dehydrogenase-like beta-hydroxyacid dehydrogenase
MASTRPRIGILHPGEMGASVAASAASGGNEVLWASEGRSAATRERAGKQQLRDCGTLMALASECSVLLSVCPPHAAEETAHRVVATGYKRMYVDANAISPSRVKRIGRTMSAAGIDFVDGGIIGPPAWTSDTTCLYLSGPSAQEIVNCFSTGPLQAVAMGNEVGQASALKMCFAAYSKGSLALLCGVLATAEKLGVRDTLFKQWTHDNAEFAGNVPKRVRQVTAKAWRFVAEMEEISATFEGAGMPGEFHAAAGAIYSRMAGFKDDAEMPPFEDVLAALLESRVAPEDGS